MQVGEPVGVFKSIVNPLEKCEVREQAPAGQKANINRHGGKCSGTALYANMGSATNKWPYSSATAYVRKKAGATWTLDNCSSNSFPVQGHHLIPKNYLPGHVVCTFLTKNYKKHPKYILEADTAYDCDNANNGYCLPYATPLAEWKAKPSSLTAEDLESVKMMVAFSVMDQTGRQLHQGSHSWYAYDEVVPDMEEENLHSAENFGRRRGYLQQVAILLSVITGSAAKHITHCRVCKNERSAGGKIVVPPRARVVEHMDQASGLLKILVDANQIFVSRLAFMRWEDEPKQVKRRGWLKP